LALVLPLSAAGVAKLGYDSDLRAIFLFDDDAESNYRDLRQSFPHVESDITLLLKGDALTSRHLTILLLLDSQLSAIQDVVDVTTILDLPAIRQLVVDPLTMESLQRVDPELARSIRTVAVAHDDLARLFVGDSKRVSRLIIQLDQYAIEDTDRLVGIKQRIESTVKSATGDEDAFHLSGFPVMKPALRNQIIHDLGTFVCAGILFALLVSALLFGELRTALLMAFGPAVGVLWTLGLMGWTGEPVSMFTSVLPPLLFVIGYANAAHIVFGIWLEMKPGSGKGIACWRGVRRVHRACAVSAITTAIGFGSLFFVGSDPVARFGLFAGLGNILTYLAVISLTPLVCERFLGSPPTETSKLFRRSRNAVQRFLFVDLPERALARGRLIVWVGTLLTLVSICLALQARPDYRFRESFSPSSAFYRAVMLGDQEFGGSFALSVITRWPREVSPEPGEYLDLQLALEQLAHQFLGGDRAVSLGSLLNRDTIRVLPGFDSLERIAEEAVLRRFVDPAGHAGLMIVPVEDVGSRRILADILRFESAATNLLERYPGYRINVTGLTFLALQGSTHVIADIAQSLGIAILAILFVISLAVRSIRTGLICMIPNILPVAGAGALLVLLGLPLQYTSVLIFAVCLGVAVDDTVHLTLRVQRLSLDGSNSSQRVVGAAIRQVGPAMVFSTLVSMAGFSALLWSDTPSVTAIGYLSMSALLLAIIADLVLLPVLLSTGRIRRKNNADSS